MDEVPVHALDYLSVVRRRKWWLFLPILLSIAVGFGLLRVLPREYRSSATLAIAAPTVSPALVTQSTTFSVDDRLRALSQQLLSTQILDRVMREEPAKPGVSHDTQIDDMRRSIDVTLPDPATTFGDSKRLDTFIVSYGDPDPARAQRITGRLASVFVDENSRTRTERAEDTAAFIGTQLRASTARLADLEGRLRQAKEAHMGQLPEQTQANLQMLAGLRQQIESNNTTLRGEQDRLTMVERQLEMYRKEPAETNAAGQNRDEKQTPEGRVAALQRELNNARAAYTSRHPDVVRLEGELENAKRELAASRGEPSSENAGRSSDPMLRQLATERDAARLRIADLQRSAADLSHQVSIYQSRVEAAPMVEQQLATVQRDYDLEKQQYSDLSAKLHNATIAESVERDRSSEQFTVLYYASYPMVPTKPVAARVLLMSIAAGIALGIALAAGREYVDRSIHDVRGLRHEFELPVLGEVGHIRT